MNKHHLALAAVLTSGGLLAAGSLGASPPNDDAEGLGPDRTEDTGSAEGRGRSNAPPRPDTSHARGPTGVTFAFQRHNMTIEKGVGGQHNIETRADGSVYASEKAKVSIAGQGARELTGVVEDEPISIGGRQKATITDETAGVTTEFSYTPGNNSILISGGGASVTVVQNPDHSYSVDGVAAADGKAAVALLRGAAPYQAASPHAVMLAWSYAHSPNAAVKNTPNCDLPWCLSGEGQVDATPPAVCTLFADFCECVACDKAGQGEACSSCQ